MIKYENAVSWLFLFMYQPRSKKGFEVGKAIGLGLLYLPSLIKSPMALSKCRGLRTLHSTQASKGQRCPCKWSAPMWDVLHSTSVLGLSPVYVPAMHNVASQSGQSNPHLMGWLQVRSPKPSCPVPQWRPCDRSSSHEQPYNWARQWWWLPTYQFYSSESSLFPCPTFQHPSSKHSGHLCHLWRASQRHEADCRNEEKSP